MQYEQYKKLIDTEKTWKYTRKAMRKFVNKYIYQLEGIFNKLKQRLDVMSSIVFLLETINVGGYLTRSESLMHCRYVASCYYLLFLGLKILSRLSYIKYEKNLRNYLTETLTFGPIVYIFGMFASSIFVYKEDTKMSVFQLDLSSIFIAASMYFLTKLTLSNANHSQLARRIQKLNKLDYGSGLAYSFFHGYLKVILPWSGRESPGFEELLKLYENKHGINIRSKKLYILIPQSTFCPQTLESRSRRIEVATLPGSVIETRAGVKNRVYHNTMYKITEQNEQEIIYVCAEYATPMHTLYEVIKHNTDASNLYKECRSELVLNFYLTLRELVNSDHRIRDLCELIYYDDEDRSNSHDIADLLLDHINRSN